MYYLWLLCSHAVLNKEWANNNLLANPNKLKGIFLLRFSSFRNNFTYIQAFNTIELDYDLREGFW